MAKSLFQDISDFFKNGNMVTKLILFNLVLSMLVLLLTAISKQDIFKYVMLSNDIIWDIKHPWVFITHLFVSKGIFNLIWTMLVLYWFGAIIGDLIGDSKVLPIYILSGLMGAFLFLLISNVLMSSGTIWIEGSSSAVLGIMVGSAILVPEYRFRLLLIGEVSLKVVVAVYIAIEFLYAISSGSFIYLAYIGSAIFGWYYIYSIRKGGSIDKIFILIITNLKQLFFIGKSKQKRNLSVKYKSNKDYISGSGKSDIKSNHTKELDRILDKIKEKGYDSLTEIEKEFLFLASKD